MTDSLERARSKWSGRTAVVTGAGSGLGAGFASVLAQLGADVVLVDVNASAVEAAAAGVGEAVVTDVREYAAVEALAERVWRDHGEVALLVNNAGIDHVGRLWERSPEDWHRVIDVNLSGVFHGIRAFVPRMLEAGTESTVLNVSSVGALMAGPQHTAYQLTKHGVLVLSEGLAAELAALGEAGARVSVAVALPGAVRTRIYVDAGATDAAVDQRARVRTLLDEQGIPPEDAATTMLEQVARGSFAVTTDLDDARTVAADRADHLRELFSS